MNQDSKIVIDGPSNIKHTKAYYKKIRQIQLDVEAKYQPLIKNEKSFFKRLDLKIRRRIEIYLEISKLTSLKKLYLN